MGRFGLRKTSQEDRAAEAPRLLAWCAELGVIPDEELRVQLEDGFGSSRSGEDFFDAVVGLFGMIDTIRRDPEPPIPQEPVVREVEGWMFGQRPGSATPHGPGTAIAT
jgi:hypothetical protein